jgi:hypothetical protein
VFQPTQVTVFSSGPSLHLTFYTILLPDWISRMQIFRYAEIRVFNYRPPFSSYDGHLQISIGTSLAIVEVSQNEMYDHPFFQLIHYLPSGQERKRHRIPVSNILTQARSIKLTFRRRIIVHHHQLPSKILVLVIGGLLDWAFPQIGGQSLASQRTFIYVSDNNGLARAIFTSTDTAYIFWSIFTSLVPTLFYFSGNLPSEEPS